MMYKHWLHLSTAPAHRLFSRLTLMTPNSPLDEVIWVFDNFKLSYDRFLAGFTTEQATVTSTKPSLREDGIGSSGTNSPWMSVTDSKIQKRDWVTYWLNKATSFKEASGKVKKTTTANPPTDKWKLSPEHQFSEFGVTDVLKNTNYETTAFIFVLTKPPNINIDRFRNFFFFLFTHDVRVFLI